MRQGSQRLAAPAAGFTLVEILLVVGILAIIAAFAVPSFRVMERHNRRQSCAANLKAIGQALSLFREDYQCYPPDATEYLWTQQAVQDYRERYGADPPGDYRLATPVGAAYDLEGQPIPTGVTGLGLYTLYYVGAYASALPPLTVEPRLDRETHPWLDPRKGVNQLSWFRGSGYIVRLDTFHCPANGLKLNELLLRWRQSLPDTAGVPYLGGWGNYDMFYRRNFWHPGYKTVGQGQGDRNLFQPYPPVDTVITWCPYHRTSNPPPGPGVMSEVNPGDEDLVLYADGSVRRMVSSKENRVFADPSGDFGFPRGPIM